jgi:hypothetical protein
MSNENIIKNSISLLKEDQENFKEINERPSGVDSPETITEIKVYQEENTNNWIKEEKEIESTAKDDRQINVIEQKIIDSPILLQQACSIIDNKIIAFNAQINGLKSQIATLSAEATAGNCWPGIACSALIGSPTVCNPENITADSSTKTTVRQDRDIIKIYPKMAGPDVDYVTDNPFDPDTTFELTSQYSGYGYQNVKQDDGGSIVTTGGRFDISGTLSNHQARNVGGVFYYKGAGEPPYATNTSVTPSRCVEIKNQIDNLQSQIVAVRAQRELENRTNLNILKDKKNGEELRSWGIFKNRNDVEVLKSDNDQAITALESLL